MFVKIQVKLEIAQNGVPGAEIKRLCEQAINHILGEGLITGETPAEVVKSDTYITVGSA